MSDKPDSFFRALKSVLSVPSFVSNFKASDKTTPQRRKSALLIDRFSRELPYAHFSDEDGLCAIEAPDGTYEGLGYVIELRPQTGASANMAKSLEQLFGSTLPEGSGIQVSLFGSPYIEPLTELIARQAVRAQAGESSERREQKALLLAIARARADFLLKSSVEGPHGEQSIRVRNLRCWISVVVPTKTPFDAAARENVLTLQKSQLSILEQWHFSPWVWNRQALVNTVSQLLNPHCFLDGTWSPIVPELSREPRMQCIRRDTRIEVNDEGVLFKREDSKREVSAVSLSPHAYPQELSLTSMIHLAGDAAGEKKTFAHPFLITTFLSKPSFERGKNRTRLKSARAEQMAATEIARFIPSLAEEARDWRAASRAYEHGEGLVQLAHQILIYPEKRQTADAIEAAKGVFSHIGIQLCVDDYMHLQGLLVSLPMTGGPLLAFDVKLAQRCTTKTMANAANTLPVLGDWKGSGPRAGSELPTPVLTLVSRRGQLVHADPFANPHGNYNGVVIGSSGSGKSVMLNELALGNLRNGGRVWVIDIGRSYEKLCGVVGGQWIELTDDPREDGAHDCLNPFSLIRNPDEDMDLILPLLAQMASPSKTLDDLMLSHLQIHFRFVWMRAQTQGKEATITDLAESLLSNGRLGGSHPRIDEARIRAYEALPQEQKAALNDPRLVDLGVQFLPYAKGGAYSTFFEGKANINFDNPFIVLELEQLNSRKALQSVVLMILMYMINLEMRKGERSQTKLVIIDEAWDLMGQGNSAAFIEAGYRRARKLNGSFFTGTQNPGDYWKNPTAKAALDNADCVFLLSMKPTSLSEIKKEGLLGLDDSEFKMLSSLRPKAGVYSEVMVRIGDEPPSVNRLLLDPFSLLLMSTHPRDLAAIKHHRDRGLTAREAISEVLRERGLSSSLVHESAPS